MLGCSRRIFVSLFPVALAFGICSCSPSQDGPSNNEGKIAGTWESTEGDMVAKFKATLPKDTNPNAIVSAVFVFKPEGDFTFGYRVGESYASIMTGKYKLGSGNTVELTDIKVTQANATSAGQTSMTVQAVVADTTMALTDKAGTTNYQRRALAKAKPSATAATAK